MATTADRSVNSSNIGGKAHAASCGECSGQAAEAPTSAEVHAGWGGEQSFQGVGERRRHGSSWRRDQAAAAGEASHQTSGDVMPRHTGTSRGLDRKASERLVIRTTPSAPNIASVRSSHPW